MKSKDQNHESRAGANRREVQRTIVELARFRYGLRKFLRFSENAARSCGITPQQHQLMLGVAGFTGRGSATVSELAEFLQGRLHSIVGLVERAEQSGLVRCAKSDEDRRVVVVSLSRHGEEILTRLSALHHEQSKRLKAFLLDPEASRELPEKQEKGVAPHRGVSKKSPARRKL